jgi:hypothetical protein
MRSISGLSEDPLLSQERLSSVEPVGYLVKLEDRCEYQIASKCTSHKAWHSGLCENFVWNIFLPNKDFVINAPDAAIGHT